MLARIALIVLALAMGASFAADRIPRSRAEIRAFRAENPCPATNRRSGACPGWQVDHVQPLCAGGEDKASNMHWLSTEDHAWKTRVDVRECRKIRRAVNTPAG